MTPTAVMTPIQNGLHLRPPTPASLLNSSPHLNKPNLERSMLDHDLHKHQLDHIQLKRKNAKKAQNRTAAFRYREKKKSEQDVIDEELELLATKNNVLKDKLTEMETEFKYLKKLMIEAGLGRYAQTVRI